MRNIFLVLIGILLSSCASSGINPSSSEKPVNSVTNTENIALFVPLTGTYGTAGQAVRDGFMAAYFNSGNPRNIHISVQDTAQNSIGNLYSQAVAKKTNLIIGPLDKASVQQLSQLSPKIFVLALNYLLKTQKQAENIFQFGLSPQNEAQQIAQYAWNNNAKRIVMIYPSSDWGRGIAGAFIQTWQSRAGVIATAMPYAPGTEFTKAIANVLGIVGKAPPRINFDSIFIVAAPEEARTITASLHYYNIQQPIYAISDIYNGTANADSNRNLDGVIFCDIPFVIDNSSTINQYRSTFQNGDPSRFQRNIRLYALGIDAYQLSQNFKQLQSNPNFQYQGFTGTLSLKQQAILRKLVIATFNNGLVQRK